MFESQGNFKWIAIKNNKVFGDAAPTVFQVGSYSGTSALTIDNVIIENNTGTCAGTGIRISGLTTVSNLLINRYNMNSSATSYHLTWDTTATANYVEITNCNFSTSSNFPHTISIPSTAGVSTVKFNRNNYISSVHTNANTITLVSSGYMEVVGNTLNGISSPFNLTATNILMSDNTKLNCSGSDTISGRYYHKVLSNNNNVETIGTVSPTSGTWNVGDVCLNSAPASAGYIGWACTVAGTPGTWKTFGLIS